VQSTRVETIRDHLPEAKRYFAIGVIPVREWFEPTTAVYLATIIHHQFRNRDFSHERVLLFMRERDLNAVSVSYLDQPYAMALAAIHKEFEIPLAYLAPNDFMRLMSDLSAQERVNLGVERRLVTWCRQRVRAIPVSWTLRPIKPFVLLEQKKNGEHVALRFDKRGRTLTLSKQHDASFVSAAVTLVGKITATVYFPGSRSLKDEHNFISRLHG
jgi:hypothetical protein